MGIYEMVGEAAVLEQLAEEALELGHACLKLSRILRGENPTPVTEQLASWHIKEEVADVLVVLRELRKADWYDPQEVAGIMKQKRSRGIERCERRYGAHDPDQGNE